MKAVVHRLSKLKLKTFKVSYSPTYTNFLLNHIATNPLHPLCLSQRRRQLDCKKEGLWWHATNGVDISRSGCVRTWARRRLREAFVTELKERGYDKTGKLVDKAKLAERADVMNVVRRGGSVDLTGSLRMHGVGPLITAKFEAVKEEVGGMVEALVQSAVDTALGFGRDGEKNDALGQRFARNSASASSRKQPDRRPVAAPAPFIWKPDVTKDLPRIKPQPVSNETSRPTKSTANRQKPTSASPRKPSLHRPKEAEATPRKPQVTSPQLRLKRMVEDPQATGQPIKFSINRNG